MARGAVRRRAHRNRGGPSGEREVDWPRLYATTPIHRLPWHSSRPAPWLVEGVRKNWIHPPGPLLDVGCGIGTNALWLARRGFRVVGLDIAPVAIDLARRKAKRAGVSIRFEQGSASSMPFESAAFAAVLDRGCFHSLPIADRPRYARELARVLRPNGSLLITWIAREETGEYGPPHRPSLAEVARVLEPYFVFAYTTFADRSSSRAWRAQRHSLALYSARLLRRRGTQPPPR